MDINEIRKRWDREAREFDAIYDSASPVQRAFNRLVRRAVFERFAYSLSYMSPASGASVLDVGCGSGIYASALLERGAARVVGVDVSASMLEIARTRLAATHADEAAQFVLGDFLQWETHDKFDYSLAMGVFDYATDPAELMRKMRSHTTGRVVASFPTHSTLRVRSALRRMRYKVQGKGEVRYYSGDEIRDLASLCGPRHVTLETLGGGQGFFLIVDL